MNTKTIEEIKADVLAYFDEHFPKGEYREMRQNDGIKTFRSVIAQTTFGVGFDLIMSSSFSQVWACSEWPAERIEWLILYRLLGLEARDAVEELARKEAVFEARMSMMDAKQGKYMDLYKAERAKSAKLVEVLEEILVIDHGTYKSEVETIKVIVSNALAAHKEGAVQV
jgi:hypothetical protein